MPNEPVLTVGSITAIIAAVLSLLVAFGVDLSDAQTQAILGLVAILGPLVAALISREKVTPLDR